MAMFGHLGFKGRQPGRILRAVGKQTIARAHGPLIGSGMGGMVRRIAKHKAVQEPAPLRGPLNEQAVHGRREPSEPQMLRKGAGARGCRAIHPRDPSVTARKARAQPILSLRRGESDGHGPMSLIGPCKRFRFNGSRGFGETARIRNRYQGRRMDEIGHACTAQTPSRGKKGQGLKNIGLARPIGTDQHHGPAVEIKDRVLIGAETGQGQPGDSQKRGRLPHRTIRTAPTGHGIGSMHAFALHPHRHEDIKSAIIGAIANNGRRAGFREQDARLFPIELGRDVHEIFRVEADFHVV